MHSATSSSRSSSGSLSPTDWEKATSPSTTALTSPNRSPRQEEYRPPVTALRAACNDCHRAKVKCVFDSPTSACIRCQKRNRDCSRSLSKPLGRARGSRKKQAAKSDSACTDTSGNTSGRSSSGSSPGATADQAAASPAVHDVSNHHGHGHDQDPGSGGGGGGDQGLGYVADFDVDSLLEGVDVNNVAAAAAAAAAAATAMDDLWFDSAAAHHGLASPGTPLLYEPMAAADTKTTRASWEQTTTPRVSHHHDAAAAAAAAGSCCSCTAALLATLRDHSHQHRRQPSSPDQLLRLNAAALDAARGCLECPVPHDAPAPLLLHLAQAIVANCRVAALAADVDADVGSGGGGGARRLGVSLGSYAVADREDGRAVARRIIALQAQKIVPVLDGLLLLLPPAPASQRDCYAAAGGRAGRGRSEGDEACRFMAGLLRAEVDGMIAALAS